MIVKWDRVVSSKKKPLLLSIGEAWNCKGLVWMLAKRDLVSIYKQTILGPLWLLIQPLLLTFAYVIIFSDIAGLPTGGVSPVSFHIVGVVFWTLFSSLFISTSRVFIDNQHLISKVYFPRLLLVFSLILSHLIRFSIQFLLMLCLLVYFQSGDSFLFQAGGWFGLIFLIVTLVIISASIGVIFSVITLKYRDFQVVSSFIVQYFMFITPVVYSFSSVPEEYRFFMSLNPLVGVFEGMRHMLLGSENEFIAHLIYSIIFSVVAGALALTWFGYSERKAVDIA